jgi:hypothetical protein
MLDRAPGRRQRPPSQLSWRHDKLTPGAVRARASRARLKEGVVTFKLRAHRKRLVAAMALANPELGDIGENTQAIEAELNVIIEAFVSRWLGPPKKPCA